MNGTRVGYARCSTDEHDVVIQTEQLLTLGIPEERIYIDRGFSGTSRRNRAGLDQALAAVWNGSVFTVTKFDRFARNMAEANQILTDLSRRGVLFGLGGSVYDWNDPFGRPFLQTLAMVAEFEANLGNLRTREGMALAKKNGKLKGKQPKLPEPPGAPSAADTPRARCPWPTWPPSTASDAPPSIASSTGQRPPGRRITSRSRTSPFDQDRSKRQRLFLGSSTPVSPGQGGRPAARRHRAGRARAVRPLRAGQR
ncbi:recombinase family protein [Nonomuraea sp. NPDC050691]|uniref:recombinase family protein n=1 Tax=Nonomuraea sp. NPDC050691 TaxID=3155661 RepID=UPI00340C42E9